MMDCCIGLGQVCVDATFISSSCALDITVCLCNATRERYNGISRLIKLHMADVPSWSRLGKLATKHQKVQAIIDTDYMGTRYKFTGPPRGDDEQQAEQDLCYIRAAAAGAQKIGRAS